MRLFSRKILFEVLLFATTGTFIMSDASSQEVNPYKLRFLREIPHSENAFIQGLEVDSLGMLIESTGLYGRSSLRKINPSDGSIEIIRPIQPNFFAEGLTRLNGKIFLATWRNGVILQFDEDSYTLEKSFQIEGEGWGLTNNGSEIILSDGTDVVKFYSPNEMRLIRSIRVQYQGQVVTNINELEYINGEIWANIWHSDDVIRINPETGGIIDRFRPSVLLPRNNRTSEEVFNGIAYDSVSNLVYFTGKYWPNYYVYILEKNN
jgi:glutamine cyclotransferase